MTPRPERLEDLEDVKLWVAEHDGRIDAFWDEQHVWNEKMENKMDAIVMRLSAVEKRMIWVAGFAAGLGSILGNLLRVGL